MLCKDICFRLTLEFTNCSAHIFTHASLVSGSLRIFNVGYLKVPYYFLFSFFLYVDLKVSLNCEIWHKSCYLLDVSVAQ